MDEIVLEPGDLAFLRELPRLVHRHRDVHGASYKAENAMIARLQRLGLLRSVIDAEHSNAGFTMAELLLTPAGRAVVAAAAR